MLPNAPGNWIEKKENIKNVTTNSLAKYENALHDDVDDCPKHR